MFMITRNKKRKNSSTLFEVPTNTRKQIAIEKKHSFNLFELTKAVREIIIYPDNLPKELCFFAQTSKIAEVETAFLRLQHAALYAEPESYTQNDKTKLAA